MSQARRRWISHALICCFSVKLINTESVVAITALILNSSPNDIDNELIYAYISQLNTLN